MHIRKTLLITKLVLVLALAYAALKIPLARQDGTEVFAPASAAGDEFQGRPERVNEAGSAADDSAVILAQNIFGCSYSQAEVNDAGQGDNPVDQAPSAEEELGLTLVGVVCGPPDLSRAIIRDGKNNTLDRYAIGRTIAGACVKSIREDTVILLHNGQEKMLRLKADGRSKDNRAWTPSSEPARKSEKPPTGGPAVTQAPAGSGAGMAPMETIFRQAVAEPHIVDGRVEGLRLTGLDDIPGVRELGLKDGDIVRTVNGHVVTSKQKAFQVLMKARSQPKISIELSRGDRTTTLSFDLE